MMIPINTETMTLTAINPEGDLLNPSFYIEKGDDPGEVELSMRGQKDLICTYCLNSEGIKVPVRYRHCTKKRPHFFHYDSTVCKGCTGESEKHYCAKFAVARACEKDGAKAEIELRLNSKEKNINRRPDVLVIYPDGTTEAHEIQLAYLTNENLLRRTNDLLEMGVKCVHWYLWGSANSLSNQQELQRLKEKAACYHLQFKEDDPACPHWTKVGYVPCKAADMEHLGVNPVAHPSALKLVKGYTAVGWTGKLGWVGYLVNYPPGPCHTDKIMDIQWVYAPPGEDGKTPDIPVSPSRYRKEEVFVYQNQSTAKPKPEPQPYRPAKNLGIDSIQVPIIAARK